MRNRSRIWIVTAVALLGVAVWFSAARPLGKSRALVAPPSAIASSVAHARVAAPPPIAAAVEQAPALVAAPADRGSMRSAKAVAAVPRREPVESGEREPVRLAAGERILDRLAERGEEGRGERPRLNMKETSLGATRDEGPRGQSGYEQWFYGQRAYPADSIPQGAVANALTHAQQVNGGLRGLPGDPTPPRSGPTDALWTALGPSSIPGGQTDLSGGGPRSPVSGRLTAIAVHPTNPNIVYAGGAQGGVWKTTNALAASPTWIPMADHQASLAIGDIRIDPVNPHIVYVGTGEPNFSCDSYYGAGVLRSTDDGNTWVLLGNTGGPFNNSGPFSGKTVSQLLIDPTTAGSATATTLFAATTSGAISSGTSQCAGVSGAARGLWRSTDSGASWTQLNVTGTANINAHGLFLDPNDATNNTLYVAVDQNGVWKSTNAKAAVPGFVRLGTGFLDNVNADPPIFRVTLAGGDNGANTTLYALMEDFNFETLWAMYRSRDGGATWTNVDNGVNGTANVTNGSTVVTRVTGPTFNASMVGHRIIVGNRFSRTVASITDGNHLTVAFGQSFTATLAGTSWSVGAYPNSCDGQCFYDMTAGVDPTDGTANTVYIGGNPHSLNTDLAACPNPDFTGTCRHSLWRSDDGGNTWSGVSQGDGVGPNTHVDDHAIYFDKSVTPARVYNGNDGGIWMSADKGSSWNDLNTNIAITQFQSVSTHPSDPRVVLGGTQDNGTELRDPARQPPPKFFHTDDGDGGQAFIDQSTPSRMFHTYFNQQFNLYGPSKSTDGGSTWQFAGAYYGYGPQYYNGINTTDPISFYAPIVKHPAFTPNVIYFGTNHVYRSPDPIPVPNNTPSWTLISPALTGGFVSAIGVVPTLLAGKEVLYAGTASARVWVSSDIDGSGVSTWNRLDTQPGGVVLPIRFITQILAPNNDATGNTAYIAYSGFNGNGGPPGHLFRTTNGLAAPAAVTWTDLTGDLPDLPVNAVAVDETQTPNVLYVGTDIGVFQSLDDGAHWYYLSNGHPVVSVFGLERNPVTGVIISSTHGRGMFQLTTSGVADNNPPVCGGSNFDVNIFNGTALDAGANDTGIASIVLQSGTNVALTNITYTSPGSATYQVSTISSCQPGSGTVRVTDYAGNFCDQAISLPGDVGADIAVTNVDSPDPVTVGNSVTYTITVTNNGPVPATGVTLTVTLPPATFVSATPSSGICSGSGPIVCTYPSIASGAHESLAVVITATSVGTLTTTASATAAQCDPNPSNNSASQSTTVVSLGLVAQTLALDAASGTGTASNANGVLEPGETAILTPGWMNGGTASVSFTGAATSFTGPSGAVYGTPDASADYGVVSAGATANCAAATGDCYLVSVSNPGTRPQTHWDTFFTETLSTGIVKTWTVHVGGSFADVPASSGQYRFVETILHKGITGGCGGDNFCPGSAVTRAQGAVFLLLSEHGSGYTPPACTTPAFADVPCSSGFAPFVNQLVAENITVGCGGGDFCPNDPVTRAQVAVFILRTAFGPTYTPPPCTTATFADVPCSSGFAPWIYDLVARGITAGCGGGNYCPGLAVTRGQAAVFLTVAFGLKLYGP